MIHKIELRLRAAVVGIFVAGFALRAPVWEFQQEFPLASASSLNEIWMATMQYTIILAGIALIVALTSSKDRKFLASGSAGALLMTLIALISGRDSMWPAWSAAAMAVLFGCTWLQILRPSVKHNVPTSAPEEDRPTAQVILLRAPRRFDDWTPPTGGDKAA